MGRVVVRISHRRSVARLLLKHSSRKSSAVASLNELFSSGTSRFLKGFLEKSKSFNSFNSFNRAGNSSKEGPLLQMQRRCGGQPHP